MYGVPPPMMDRYGMPMPPMPPPPMVCFHLTNVWDQWCFVCYIDMFSY